jgi:predicted dehydrogenase
MEEIRWGIIGCGNVCEKKSAPAFNMVEGSRLVAVMRRDEARVRDFARRHGVPKWYTDAGDLLDDLEVNAVYVATPPNLHARFVIQALQTGKPVYVEKPMATSYRECLQMKNASQAAGKPLFVAYYYRSLPYFQKVKQILDEGRIGKVTTVSLTHIVPPKPSDFDRNSPPWRLDPQVSGGGYFFDLACHQIDLLDFLFGPVVFAEGAVSNLASLYVPADTVVASLGFQTGVLAGCCWCYAGGNRLPVDRLEIHGTHGKITFCTSRRKPVRVFYGDKMEKWNFRKPGTSQLCMIESICRSLLGQEPFPSNQESAARTSWAMDKIFKRIRP